MPKFRKKPVVIDAIQWFRNGDHPRDYLEDRPFTENGVLMPKPGEFFRQHDWEGGIVRYFRHPEVSGTSLCAHCGRTMHLHGWIDTLEGGHIVCPGDWIITGIKGEIYPCKPDIFAQTYDLV